MDRRLTPDARRTVQAAQGEARRLNQSAVGPEHLLLALVKLAEDRGRDPDPFERVRALFRLHGVGATTLEAALPPGGPAVATPPMSAAARRAVDGALRSATASGSTVIDVGHLLIGVVGAAEGPLARWLADHGLGPDEAAQALPDPVAQPTVVPRPKPRSVVEELSAPPIDGLDPIPPE